MAHLHPPTRAHADLGQRQLRRLDAVLESRRLPAASIRTTQWPGMRRTKEVTVRQLRIVLVLLLTVGLFAGQAVLAAEPVKIGFITSLSGPAGIIGKHMKDSVELALEHLGRKVGGLDVEVIYGDDQRKPDVGKQLADEMLKKHKVNFVSGIIWSNVMLAVAPTVTGAGTIMVGTNAGPHELAGKMCSELYFTTSWQNALYSVYPVDEISLPAVGEAALGNYETRYWSPDLKNEANAKYVGDFKKKFGYTPSFYGAQSYDGILLIDSAVRAVRGDLGNKKGMVAAMRKADFRSTRGKFSFNVNHTPIQNFYLLRAVKGAGGDMEMQIQKTVFENHKDAYYQECPMKW